MAPMIIVGLDCATTSGWSRFDGESVTAGKFKASGATDGAIFRSFEDQLRALLIETECTHLAMEEPLRSDLTKTTIVNPGQHEVFGRRATTTKVPITNMSTLRRLYGLAAIVHKAASDLGITIEEVNQRSWRSEFLGAVSPPKGCTDRTGWWKDRSLEMARSYVTGLKSKDAADAVGVGFYLYQKLTGGAKPGDLFSK